MLVSAAFSYSGKALPYAYILYPGPAEIQKWTFSGYKHPTRLNSSIILQDPPGTALYNSILFHVLLGFS
jgi:hypothetical protein